jgi:hypothetical protein
MHPQNAMFCAEARPREQQVEVAVRDWSSPRLQGLAAVVVAMALCGAAGAALHAKKEYAHKSPVRYVHCAMELDEGPCGFDPAMRRLHGQPPDLVRPAPPLDQPHFLPER